MDRSNRQTIRARLILNRWAQQRAWRPDYRDGRGIEWMLAALCVAIPLAVLVLYRCGGPQ